MEGNDEKRYNNATLYITLQQLARKVEEILVIYGSVHESAVGQTTTGQDRQADSSSVESI